MYTETETWSVVAVTEQIDWEARAKFISKFIRSTDRVVDFGAGNRKLSRFIASTCEYIPVDCVDDLPGTYVVDYNIETRFPDQEFDVAVCAGFLEYLDDLPGFFRALSERAPGKTIIFTYLFSDESKRQDMKLHNSYPNSDALLADVGHALSAVNVVAHHRHTTFYIATLSPSGGAKLLSRELISDLLASPVIRVRRLTRLVRKLKAIFGLSQPSVAGG